MKKAHMDNLHEFRNPHIRSSLHPLPHDLQRRTLFLASININLRAPTRHLLRAPRCVPARR